MKKRQIIIAIIGLLIILLLVINVITTNNIREYQGYWCKYDESSTIVVLLKKDNKESDRTKIEAKAESFTNVNSITYYSREDYANDMGGDPDELDIYDTYVITLNTMDSIGTYIEELKAMSGVLSAEQSYAKSNVSLFNIQSWGKYTYTDSDEATTDQLEHGTYKNKKGVITFTPDDKKGEQKILYIKDGYLCGDAACTKIYAKSNSTCSGTE